jgi:Zn-finger nucleic acid-binding protein
MREREQGDVIIDICPQCRGVWLDPGELEKLSVRESRYYERGDDDDDDDDWDDDRRRDARRGPGDSERSREYERFGSYGQPRKKRGFLASMMENFGGEGGDD